MMMAAGETAGDEGGGYKFDPSFQDYYRCPVSTPANNQKRPVVQYDPVMPAPVPVHDRKSVIGFNRPPVNVNRNKTRNMDKPMRKNVEYYFVDSHLQKKELHHTNSYWLQSLCAQPVTEILGKYRRKSDFQRTRFLWSKMFSTPGERALLQAWTNNKSPRAVTASADMRTKYRQPLSFSKEMKVDSTVSTTNSRKSDSEDMRAQLASAGGSQYESENQSISRGSPTMRSEVDDAQVSRIVLADNEALPNLSGQRRKGQLVLQQRKYFSGNRRHPAIPHVQRLNPVKTEDIAQSADVICLKPTQKPATPRVMSRAGSRDRQASAKSLNDADNVQVKFPLIVSTREEGKEEPKGKEEEEEETSAK